MVKFGQSGCSRAKVVVIEEKWFYLSKSCFILVKLLYSGKVVVFVEKWLYLDKVVVSRAKVVLILQS